MVSDRAKKGGGSERPLNDSLTAGVPGQPNPNDPGATGGPPEASSRGIQRGTNADWFGPLNPMDPTAPPEVAGRKFDYQSGYNLTQQPRAYAPVSFGTLRGLADGWDVLRTIIETRKDQMERMKWSIGPRDLKKREVVNADTDGRIATLEKFFLRPDRRNFWGEWLRMILEDLLVLDAPTVYKRRTRGGDLYSLEVIDGSTIKPVIDDWGRTPEPPLAAYQQALKGFPAVNYSTRDILYRPRNLRSNQVYGYSPVEQIIMTIQIALKRQVFQLEFFTSGNMPEALIGVPETWTPDQIRQFQDWFDNMLTGNLEQRRQAKFVPAAVGKTYIPTKETELFGKAEEWLARVACFAFSISPQPFVNMMNRATADTAQETAVMDGLLPIMTWVKNTIDTIILDDFGIDDLEFNWVEEDELDPKVESEIITSYAEDGIITLNEARKRMGADPRPEPEFDRPMMKTATGYVPVALTAEEKAAKEAAAAAISGQAPPGEKKDGKDDGQKEGAEADAVTAPAAQQAGNAPPTDSSNLGKRHDDAIVDVERVAQRDALKDDAVVTFGATADAKTVERVLNTAALKEPNWR